MLSRLEPLVVLGVVAHAIVAWTTLDPDLASLLIVLAAAVAGLAAVFGLIRPGGPMSMVRAVLAIAVVIGVGEATGGIAASVWTAWLAILALCLPMSMERKPALAVPVVLAGAHLATVGGDALGPVDALLRSVTFAAIGVASYLLGHHVLTLRVERDRVAGRLAEAESVIDAAFATSLGGMAVLDLNGRVVAANDAFAGMLNRAAGSIDGAELSLLVHPSETESLRSGVAAVAAGTRHSHEAEVRFMRVDGSVAHTIVGLSAVDDADGAPRRVFAHITNVSDRVHSERRLRQSESHHRHLFELSPVPLWEIDLTEAARIAAAAGADLGERSEDLAAVLEASRVRSVNEAARDLFGAGDERHFADGLAAGRLGRDHAVAYGDLVLAITRGILRGERPVTAVDFAGGEHVGLLRVLVPRVEGEPDLTGVVVAFVDTTEQAEAEETLVRLEEQLHTVMSGAPIIVFAVDADGVYTLSEGAALDRIGQRAGDAVGRSVFEVHRASPTVVRNMRRALAGETFAGVDEMGGLLFETRYSPVFARDGISGVVGVSYDITDRVRTAERLRELVRSKDDFVATVSHELRTPLTAVVGFAHELRSGLDGLASEDVATYLGLIEEQATEVTDLVEDLLVASRSDQGEVPISLGATDLWEQVDAVLGARPLRKQVNTDDRSTDGKVFADAIRVRQIIRNLLINADRYGGEHVTVRVLPNDGARVLEVRDDGQGIAEAHRAFIFEPYHRAHRVDGRTESVGLGLTVSRHLAELMGGTLEYRYHQGESVFSLTLPAT